MENLKNPSEKRVAADLAAARFRVGITRNHWHIKSYNFPFLFIGVNGMEQNGDQSEYVFRFELTGFPGAAPEVKIWDTKNNSELPVALRPKGPSRVAEAFKEWGHGIYRPWEREAGAHGDWNNTYPNLAWHPSRDLTFILEDLYALLNIFTGSTRSTA